MGARCAADLSLWILANDRAQVRSEIFKAHRCKLFAFGWSAHSEGSIFEVLIAVLRLDATE